MKSIFFNILLILSFLFFAGCNDNKNNNNDKDYYAQGVLVSCEGLYKTGSGDVTFYCEYGKISENKIFEKANTRLAGNIVQSVTRHNDYTVLVVNNGNKIEIVDSKTFKSVKTISDIILPRYYTAISDEKGYVTTWNKKIYIIDLKTLSVSGTIDTGHDCDQIKVSGNIAWVLNSGGFSSDNTATLINIREDKVIKDIETEYYPNGIQKDNNGNIWIICGGKNYFDITSGQQVYETKPRLLRFDGTNYTQTKEIIFENISDYVTGLAVSREGTKLFFSQNGEIMYLDLSANNDEIKSLYKPKGSIYAFDVNPRTGQLFVSDPIDWNSNGKVYIIDSNTGIVESSFETGIIPGHFAF